MTVQFNTFTSNALDTDCKISVDEDSKSKMSTKK